MKKLSTHKWIVAGVVGLCVLVFLKFFVFAGARVGYFEDDKRFATAGVNRFHSQYNAGSQSALNAAMTQWKQKFGDVVNAVQVGANVFPGGQVRFVYHTQFQEGATTEMFIWQSDGQKASLMQYQVYPGTVKPSLQTQP